MNVPSQATTPGEPTSNGLYAWARAHLALILLAGVLASAAVVLLALGWRLGFFLDDWTFMLYRRGSIDQSYLNPHGENVVIGLALVYKFLLATFGMDSAVPFRVTLVLLSSSRP